MTCANCLDAVPPLLPEGMMDDTTEEGCCCPCGDPSMVYCTPQCRSLHWIVHRRSCITRGIPTTITNNTSSSSPASAEASATDMPCGQSTPPRRDSNRHTAIIARTPMLRSAGVGAPTPKYVEDAEHIIAALKRVPGENNTYAPLPSYIKMQATTAEGEETSVARTQCATFISRLWKYSYGLSDRDLRAWLHSDLVWGEDYYNHIVAGNGFARVGRVSDIAVGDLIAMKYERTAFNTGHVMIIRDIAPLDPAIPPVVEGTKQWKVRIIDSTRIHHMYEDSRYPPAGGTPGGIGEGYCRLYSTADRIVGYCWSTWPRTTYYGEGGARQFAVGRPVHLLEQVKNKLAQKKDSSSGATSGGGVDEFKFESSASSDFSDSGSDDIEDLSIRCGEATESAGKELVMDADFQEAATVWYIVGRSRVGFQTVQPMLISSECYRKQGKLDAALRATDKAYQELRAVGAAAALGLELRSVAEAATPISVNVPSAQPDYDNVSQYQLLAIAFMQLGLISGDLGHGMNALRHLRDASLTVRKLQVFPRKEEPHATSLHLDPTAPPPSTDSMSHIPLQEWCTLMLRFLIDTISSTIRTTFPSVYLKNATGAAGLSLFAAVAVPAGRCILHEQPLMVWRDNEEEDGDPVDGSSRKGFVLSISLLRAFDDLNPQDRQLILSLHCPSLPPADYASLRRSIVEFLCNHELEVSTMRHIRQHELPSLYCETSAASVPPSAAGSPRSPSTVYPTCGLVAAMMKLALIVKCNAHDIDAVDEASTLPNDGGGATSSSSTRQPTYSAFFDLMSKAQHSCSPNLFYDSKRTAYHAMRDLKPGEELTFSYAGRSILSQSTPQRRSFLYQRYAFLCRCPRCEGPDYSRGISCPLPACGGTRYRGLKGADGTSGGGDAGAPKGDCWVCDSCGEWWPDADMGSALAKEKKLEGKLEEVGTPIRAGKLIKNQFDHVKDLFSSCRELSQSGCHWTMLEATKLVAQFFINVSAGRGAATRLVGRRLASQWTEQYLQLAVRQRLTQLVPTAVAEELFTMASGWGAEISLTSAKVKAYRIAYPFFASSFPESDACRQMKAELEASAGGLPDIQRSLQQASDDSFDVGLSSKELKRKKKKKKALRPQEDLGVPSSADDSLGYWTLLPEVGVDVTQTELFDEWEKYLSSLVSQSLNSNRTPNLPPDLLRVIQQGQAGGMTHI